MKLAIHQPEHLPCLALLNKVRHADAVVLLDDVQFNRASLQHRARIADGTGTLRWLTVPFVHRFPQRICDVEIAESGWWDAHVSRLETAYRLAPAFPAVMATLCTALRARSTRLLDVVYSSFHAVLAAFGLDAGRKVLLASQLGVAAGDKSDRVLALCTRLCATHYVSGRAGSTYLDREAFARAGVQIEVPAFAPASYRPTLSADAHAQGLSALDAWMYLGAGRTREAFAS